MISIQELYSLFLKHNNVFTDSRLASSGGIFFALKGDKFDGNNFALKAISDGADFAVVDRIELAKEPQCLWVKDVLQTLQNLANHHRKQLKIPVLGITGTNGKTTTKELITSVLKQKYLVQYTKGNLNNHIGVPLTLLSINQQHTFAVVEMGANHQGEIKFLCEIAEPNFGIITNVGKAHLEGFGSFEGVMIAKGEMYDYISKFGEGIFINVGNDYLQQMSAKNTVKYTYGVTETTAQLKGEIAGNDLFVVAKVLFEKGWLYLKSNMTGAYNFENILAAARIGVYFDIDPLQIQKGIEEYIPSNNRSQIVKRENTTVLVDCYNANPTSMEASIHNFMQQKHERKVLVLGDMLELGNDSLHEHQKIIDQIINAQIEEVFLIGPFFGSVSSPSFFYKYETIQQLISDIDKFDFKNKFILLKGSRGIQLERFLDWV